MRTIDSHLKQTQLTWAFHVARISDDGLYSVNVCGWLEHGKHSQSEKKKKKKKKKKNVTKTYALKASLKDFTYNSWESATKER